MTQPKHTPEERVAIAKTNGVKLAGWRRLHPMTDAERSERAELSRQVWANMSDKTRRELSKKQSAHAKIQMSDPAAREKAAEYAREGWEKSHHKARFAMTDDIARKISEAQIGKPGSFTKLSPERQSKRRKQLAEMSRANSLREDFALKKPDVHERAIQGSIIEGKTNPLRGRFETNCAARDWHIRDPLGAAHHFRNLRHFIRNNRELFSDDELKKRPNGRDMERCKIDSLGGIRPDRQFPVCSWHGWTWIAGQYEDQYTDPLNRMAL